MWAWPGLAYIGPQAQALTTLAVALSLALPHPLTSPDNVDVLTFACPAAWLLVLWPSYHLTHTWPWPWPTL